LYVNLDQLVFTELLAAPKGFRGVLIVVSHDEGLVDEVGIDIAIELED
jgi:ATPase subunit of ABC transporter with duplicated ATPase domains